MIHHRLYFPCRHLDEIWESPILCSIPLSDPKSIKTFSMYQEIAASLWTHTDTWTIDRQTWMLDFWVKMT